MALHDSVGNPTPLASRTAEPLAAESAGEDLV
jgi:hypothetical protein